MKVNAEIDEESVGRLEKSLCKCDDGGKRNGQAN
jgi:hypothetical protein